MLLSLPLQANGTVCCTTAPTGAIIRQQEERREREQKEQVNMLINELGKRGEPVEITINGDTELLIKRGKKVDKNENQEMSLRDAIALVSFAGLFVFFPIFIERFLRKRQ